MLAITSISQENHNVTSLIFEGPEVVTFAQRRAGQFALLKIMRDGRWSEVHPFTLTCAPEDPFLQMTIKAVGPFTSSLRNLSPPTPAQLKGPLGSFCKDIDEKPAVVLIAGGIGITPFLSVLRHWCNTGARNRATLVWANNETADIFARQELTAMTERLDLRIVHVIWKPGADLLPPSTDRIVYENGVLTAEILKRTVEFSGAAVYLCGSPTMQGFVFPQLEACGVDTKSVAVEKFAWPPRVTGTDNGTGNAG